MNTTNTFEEIQVAVPESPQHIGDISEAYPTLDELKEMTAVWLEAALAAGKIEKLFFIGRMLGELGATYPHSKRIPPRRVSVGEACLHYQIQRSMMSGQVAIHGNFEVITVTVGGEEPHELLGGRRAVCVLKGDAHDPFTKIKFTHAPQVVTDRIAKNYFIPGDWEGSLLELYGKAKKVNESLVAKKYNNQRNDLLQRIGVRNR